ncbi:MAG: hypothetical protein WDZ35_09605 [Crocinitomicaceae bacterium]
MKHLINQLGVGDSFSIRTIIAVEELSHHDMIYVYHHIREGSLLDLEYVETTLSGHPRYRVKFKNFIIGFVKFSGMTKAMFEEHIHLRAEVASISKEKYMPFKALDIQLGMEALKKVG